MKTIAIVEQDKVGLLMDISYILGKEKINIESITANAIGGKAVITITVKKGDEAKKILAKNGFHIMEEDVIMVEMDDKPGELANLAKILKDNELLMSNLYVVSKDGRKTIVAIKIDKMKKAKKVLHEKGYLVEDQDKE
jgi:hypothetical protein